METESDGRQTIYGADDKGEDEIIAACVSSAAEHGIAGHLFYRKETLWNAHGLLPAAFYFPAYKTTGRGRRTARRDADAIGDGSLRYRMIRRWWDDGAEERNASKKCNKRIRWSGSNPHTAPQRVVRCVMK